jgi:hypothetical protein
MCRVMHGSRRGNVAARGAESLRYFSDRLPGFDAKHAVSVERRSKNPVTGARGTWTNFETKGQQLPVGEFDVVNQKASAITRL